MNLYFNSISMNFLKSISVRLGVGREVQRNEGTLYHACLWRGGSGADLGSKLSSSEENNQAAGC